MHAFQALYRSLASEIAKKASERLWTVYNYLKWRWIRFDT